MQVVEVLKVLVPTDDSGRGSVLVEDGFVVGSVLHWNERTVVVTAHRVRQVAPSGEPPVD